ncbi:hypothetical protein EBR66_02355 [bacterium]|nr:hypothetical protein [bacterium]
MNIMPPGHERWYAFEEMLSIESGERRNTLVFLRNQMVMVQVLRYVSFIVGLWTALVTNLALTLGLGISCDTVVIMFAPWTSAFGCVWLAWTLHGKPAYVQMCMIISTDSSLLPLLRQASKDDPVLLPALEIIEGRLAKCG